MPGAPRGMPPRTVAEKDPFDLSGVVIDGKYRVASVVGDGGFGVVYRGVHKGFGELIAIKCLKLPTELSESDRAELLEKLQEEGRLLPTRYEIDQFLAAVDRLRDDGERLAARVERLRQRIPPGAGAPPAADQPPC